MNKKYMFSQNIIKQLDNISKIKFLIQRIVHLYETVNELKS